MQATATAPELAQFRPSARHAGTRALQVRAASEGDVAALVASVEGTIRQTVGHYGRGFSQEDREDLLAAGRIGAIEAAQRYDTADARGASFNTYAKYWIRVFVVREVFFFWGRGRFSVTQSTSKVFFRYRQVRRDLEGVGVDPTPEAIAAVLGVPASTLRDVLGVISALDGVYDEAPDPDSERVVGVTAVDESSPSALEALCGYETSDEIRGAIRALPPRSQYVIVQRFFEGKRLWEVADAIGLSRERIRQIEEEAVARIRESISG